MRLRARPVVRLERTKKARMISAFLEDIYNRPPAAQRILDVGCGNGDIAAFFAEQNLAVGLDIRPQCRTKHGQLAQCLGRSEALPFQDGAFDVVISHHVIEHVDDHDGHMAEIRRVLAPGGICYLGTPNRTSPFMRGHVGNSMVLPYSRMRPLFERHGFSVTEYYTRWLHEPDRYHCDMRIGRLLPTWMLHLMRHWYPSQAFLLRLV